MRLWFIFLGPGAGALLLFCVLAVTRDWDAAEDPDTAVYFVQFQAPPALVHSLGRWHSAADIFCLSLSTAAYHNVDLVLLGPTGQALANEKAGKGAALQVGRRLSEREGKGPPRRLGRRLEEVAKAVGGRLLSVTNAIDSGWA